MTKILPTAAVCVALVTGFAPVASASAIPDEFGALTVTPAQGDVPGLSLVTLEFADYADVDVSKPGDVILYKDDAEMMRLSASNVDNAYGDYEEVIAFTFTPEIKEAGSYRLLIPAGALNIIEKGTFRNFPNSAPLSLEWTVVGPVVYDLLPTRIKPAEGEIDLSAVQFENVIVTVPAADIRPREGATATLVSADGTYSETVPLKYNFGTQLIAFFDTPVYNGKYTFTIPQGSFGTPIWLTNNEIGNANPEITVSYNIVGGRNNNNVTYDLAPSSVLPEPGTSAKSLKEFTLTFGEDVYVEPDARGSLAVGFGRYFATAPIVKVDNKTYILTFSPIPTEEGDYTLRINEGIFYDSVNAADRNEGRMNADLEYTWSMGALVDILSTEPADEGSLGTMPTGYQIVINTSDNAMVSRIELEMTEMPADGGTERTVISGESEQKTVSGAICWENTGAPIELYEGYTYTIYYTLYNASDDAIKMSVITFSGLSEVGVVTIESDAVCPDEIYNLQGIRIRRPRTALPAGLYIINGRKVHIR